MLKLIYRQCCHSVHAVSLHIPQWHSAHLIRHSGCLLANILGSRQGRQAKQARTSQNPAGSQQDQHRCGILLLMESFLMKNCPICLMWDLKAQEATTTVDVQKCAKQPLILLIYLYAHGVSQVLSKISSIYSNPFEISVIYQVVTWGKIISISYSITTSFTHRCTPGLVTHKWPHG